MPSILRRFISLCYEGVLLAALLFVAAYLVVGLLPAAPAGALRASFQAYLALVGGGYFVWFWRHGGQTLAMQTWRIRLVDAGGGRVGLGQAWLRYGLALLGTLALGLGFLWALVDRDRQFLHDRLAGTRLVSVPPPATGRPRPPG